MPKTRDPRPATGHIPPFGLRMQPDLKARLEASAKTTGRSLNAEIVARLEASFAPGIDDRLADQMLELINKLLTERANRAK